MDLQDFDGAGLYFDEPQSAQVQECMRLASEQYGQGGAEHALLRAQALAPQDLGVLVGLYRFYYYQHRYQDALGIAARAMLCVGPRLQLPSSWRDIQPAHLARAAAQGVGLLRFYLLTLKGAGYLCLRLGHFEQGKAMLAKVSELDRDNRLGARLLLDVLVAHDADVIPFPIATRVENCP
jgi:tetratricopeptide (TPR) repeat protein